MIYLIIIQIRITITLPLVIVVNIPELVYVQLQDQGFHESDFRISKNTKFF